MATPDSLNLLQQMLSPEPADREALARALEAHEDPRVRLIAQYMSHQASASEPLEADEAERSDSVEVAVDQPGPDAGRIERMGRARRKLRQLIDDLEVAQRIGDTLAAALGACYLCWGEDPGCAECAGDGAAGWALPDAELFDTFVEPASQRMNHHRTQTPATALSDGPPTRDVSE